MERLPPHDSSHILLSTVVDGSGHHWTLVGLSCRRRSGEYVKSAELNANSIGATFLPLVAIALSSIPGRQTKLPTPASGVLFLISCHWLAAANPAQGLVQLFGTTRRPAEDVGNRQATLIIRNPEVAKFAASRMGPEHSSLPRLSGSRSPAMSIARTRTRREKRPQDG